MQQAPSSATTAARAEPVTLDVLYAFPAFAASPTPEGWPPALQVDSKSAAPAVIPEIDYLNPKTVPLTDKEKKDKLADNCMLGFAYNQKTTHGAPALVVLTMIKERSGYERDGSFSTPLATHWQSFDAGIAAQTFCLSAHALGLGTVIMGIYDPAEVAKVVKIPEGQEVAALIALGHPAQDPQAPARKDVDTLLRFE